MKPGTLYLLPVPMGESRVDAALPQAAIDLARRIGYLLAEDARSARAFLKAVGHPQPIVQIRIVEIGHHPDAARLDEWLADVRGGTDAAVVSEAGCPGVADPGAIVAARAHELGIPVKALVGPSALLLALMASGLEGQRFRFLGYLPRESGPLQQRLREIERQSRDGDETQIFIETPYRNERLLKTILNSCRADTRLCVAVDLTTPGEAVMTRAIGAWTATPPEQRPSLDRRPAVFLLLAAEPADQGQGGRNKPPGRQ
jgi:16S rRNA (cytidine1402-2'-O)-methyltransferase